MKFTQISTLALAAMMAFSSCSKEEVMNSGEVDLQPGEARIVLDLGRTGSTTYSTAALEKAINDGSAKLFINKDGATKGTAIPMTSAVVSKGGVLSATVAAEEVAKAAGPVTMYVYVNAGTVTPGATGTDMAKHAAATTAQALTRELTTGAPAGLSVNFDLVPGTFTVPTAAAKRAIARVEADNVTTTGTSIKNFEITFDAVNVTSGALYAGATNGGSTVAGTTKNLICELLETGLTDIENATNKNETVAYLYPSSKVTATVKAPDGMTKIVSFEPKANMNYTIKINPKPAAAGDGTIDFTVTIAEAWEIGNGDLNADFNGDASDPKMKVQPDFTSGSASLKSGVLQITTDGKKSLELDIKSLVGDVSAFYDSFAAIINPKTRAAGDFGANVDELTHKLTISYPAVYNASTVEAVLTIYANHSTNEGEPESLDIPLKVIGKALPAGFLVDMGGMVFPAINSTGSIDGDIALFNKINAQGTGTFAQKYINYLKSDANFVEATGKKFANAAIARTEGCPIGFKVPATADYKILLQNTFNTGSSGFTTSNPTQYNVGAVGVMESITDGARKIVPGDRKVGIFTTGIAGGDPANKAYRLFDYKGAQLVFTVTSASTVYGGLYTSDGNAGMNGNGTSATVYTEANGSTPNMQIRCIKDDAANVIW